MLGGTSWLFIPVVSAFVVFNCSYCCVIPPPPFKKSLSTHCFEMIFLVHEPFYEEGLIRRHGEK